MKQKWISLFVFLWPVFSAAQINISVQLPAAGLVQKEQLWTIVLVNVGDVPVDGRISMSLQDAVSGQPVLSAVTGNIQVTKGVKVLTLQDIQPVQYNYLGGQLTNNFLPAGSYVACYQLSESYREAGKVLGSECVKIRINPLSPPLLNQPGDKSVIETPYPQFTWVSPTPSEMLTDLSYSIFIAEIMEGQSPVEAINNNVPVYSNSFIKAPYQSYPSSYSQLQPGKKYAWRVEATGSNQYTVSTDVWTFSLRPADTVKTEIKPVNYLLLRNNSDQSGINYIEGNFLYVKYYSFDKDWNAPVLFVNSDGSIVQRVQQQIIYGDNYFAFKLNNYFRKDNTYQLIVKDQSGNEHRLLFSLKK